MLRDSSDPFQLPENTFQKYFRLSRDSVRHVIDVLGPHLQEGQRKNALSREIKVSQQKITTTFYVYSKKSIKSSYCRLVVFFKR